MNKLIQAFTLLVVGTVAIGAVFSSLYVFLTFSTTDPSYISHYGRNIGHALATFMINPLEGGSIETDDEYIRNVIFAFSMLIVGSIIFRKL